MLDLSLELTGASGGACSSVDAAMKQFTKAEYLEQVSKPNPNPHPKTLILTLILTLAPTPTPTVTRRTATGARSASSSCVRASS